MAGARLRGNRVAQLRRAAGLLQAGLAARLEISDRRVGEWERGEQQPQPRHLVRLAAALGVDPLELLDVDPLDPPLLALRLSAGLTLHEVAAASGISYTTYRRLENGALRHQTTTAASALAPVLRTSAQRVQRAIARGRADQIGR